MLSMPHGTVFRCFCRQNRLLLPGTKLATLLSPAPPHVRPSRRESPHSRLHLLNGRTVGQRNAGRRRPRRAATEDLLALRERCYRCDVGCEGDNCHPRREANLGLPFRRRELCRAGGARGAAARRVSSGGLQPAAALLDIALATESFGERRPAPRSAATLPEPTVP